MSWTGFLIQKEIIFRKGLSIAYILVGRVMPQNTKGIFKSSIEYYWQAVKKVVKKFTLTFISSILSMNK